MSDAMAMYAIEQSGKPVPAEVRENDETKFRRELSPRFALGGGLSVVEAVSSAGARAYFTGPGVTLDFGLGKNGWFVFARGYGYFAPVGPAAMAGLEGLLEWTPVPSWSFATGFGVAAVAGSVDEVTTLDWNGPVVPIVFAWNHTPDGEIGAMRVSLNLEGGAGGDRNGTMTTVFTQALNISYVWR